MTFDHLPQNWSERPITDPGILADVLDLLCDETSRQSGALFLLLCHPDGRLLAPVAIDKIPNGRPVEDIARGLRPLLGQLAQDDELPGTLVIAVTRPGPPTLTNRDRQVREALTAAALDSGVTLLGFGIVTPTDIHTFPGATPATSRRVA